MKFPYINIYYKISGEFKKGGVTLKIFDYLQEDNYEQLIFFQSKDVGLKAIICIHNTALGPALGGTRLWNYQSEEEAIEDALRLARGMTYKNAAAGLNAGGGKAAVSYTHLRMGEYKQNILIFSFLIILVRVIK